MGFPHKMCTCDPSRFVLSQIFTNFVQFFLRSDSDPIGLEESEIAGACYLCSIPGQPKGGRLSEKFVDRIDRCIKVYRLVNITQRTTWISGFPSLSVTFTPEYMKSFCEIWGKDETRTDLDEQTILNAFDRSLQW